MRRLVPLAVAVLAAVPFLSTLSGSFLNWDDNVNFLENPAYRGLDLEHVRWAFTSVAFGHYIPLTRLTWSLNWVLGGMNPWGYHLVNVLLHAVNAALFYVVARRLLAAAVADGAQAGRRGADLCAAAAVAALVFGVHPLRVEPVAWITGRPDLLCGSFVLLTTWAYLRATESGGPAHRGLIGIASVTLAAALLSKGAALPFVGALFILDVYPLRRVRRLGLPRPGAGEAPAPAGDGGGGGSRHLRGPAGRRPHPDLRARRRRPDLRGGLYLSRRPAEGDLAGRPVPALRDAGADQPARAQIRPGPGRRDRGHRGADRVAQTLARRPRRVGVLDPHARPDERGGEAGCRSVARPLHLPLRHGIRRPRGGCEPRPDPTRSARNPDPFPWMVCRLRGPDRDRGPSRAPRGATAWSGGNRRRSGAGPSRSIPTAASATASSERAPSAGRGDRRGPWRPRRCSDTRSPCGRISPTRTTTSEPRWCSRGDIADAEAPLRNYMERAPWSPSGPERLGLVYLLQGDYEAAVPLLRTAFVLKPGAPDLGRYLIQALEGRAQALSAQGRGGEAGALLAEARAVLAKPSKPPASSAGPSSRP